MMKSNEERKLTKIQKVDKTRRKFERDIKKDCKACLFRIEDLSDVKKKFKLDMNAKQLFLTGICIYNNKNSGLNLPNLLLVEGGPLAIKKYKNLCLRRIKWDESEGKNATNEESDDEEDKHKMNNMDFKENKNCILVWEVSYHICLFINLLL